MAFKPDHSSDARKAAHGSDVSLPIDYYSLLSLPPHGRFSGEAVKRALDKAIKTAPSITYQEETLFSRAVRLKTAAQVLADEQEKKAYDERRASVGTERLSQHDFPGALVLLQEVGDYESVIHYGRRWLDNNLEADYAADVAKCLALAYCDRAGDVIQADSSAVVACCEDLEAAQRLLQRWSSGAEQLGMQIEDALQVRCWCWRCRQNEARMAQGFSPFTPRQHGACGKASSCASWRPAQEASSHGFF